MDLFERIGTYIMVGLAVGVGGMFLGAHYRMPKSIEIRYLNGDQDPDLVCRVNDNTAREIGFLNLGNGYYIKVEDELLRK